MPEPRVLRFVVLPLQPLAETTEPRLRFAERTLAKHLRDHPRVELVAASRVAQAMKALGITSPSQCDQRCLIRLGRRLRAHRVLRGSVRMQDKVQSKGTVWEFSADLVHVPRRAPWGHYQTVCICWRGQQAKLLKRQVRRMLSFHPDRWTLKMTRPTPVPAPADAPRVQGMVYVPAGEFIMGSEYGELDESPRHVVYTDAFFIDRYEVTNAEYDRCVKAQRCIRSTTRKDPRYGAPRQPVAGVGFKDAVAYCRFAGKRLLTEAEWEKAARGIDERIYPWGDAWEPKWLNLHWDKDGFAATAPVGSFPKNVSPFGAYDMAGNVWEWTSDLWHPKSYRHSTRRNPKGSKHGDGERRRVMRGGTWMYDVPFFSRTHNRSPGRPWIRKRYVGIRCGKDAPPVGGR